VWLDAVMAKENVHAFGAQGVDAALERLAAGEG
jgi:hypothetical protein